MWAVPEWMPSHNGSWVIEKGNRCLCRLSIPSLKMLVKHFGFQDFCFLILEYLQRYVEMCQG